MGDKMKFEMTTIHIIRAAYVLLSHMEKDSITVTDICNEADVNRSTFYAHFKDIDEVFSRVNAELVDLCKSIRERKIHVSEETCTRIFQMIYNKRENFLKRIRNGYSLGIGIILVFIYINKEDLDKLCITFWNAALNEIVEAWLLYETDRTPEEMASIFYNRIIPTIRKFKGGEEFIYE